MNRPRPIRQSGDPVVDDHNLSHTAPVSFRESRLGIESPLGTIIADDEVNRAARRIIGDGKFALAVIGPAKKILPQVKEWGEAAVFPFKSRPESWPK